MKPAAHRVTRIGDTSLTVLLIAQSFTLFFVIPFGAVHPGGRLLLDLDLLLFAVVCVTVFTRRRLLQAALILGLALLAAPPVVEQRLGANFGLDLPGWREVIACVAFAFISLVTMLVARQVFGPGRVTQHRILGAVLVYLNVAALFGIALDLLETHWPGALAPTTGGRIPTAPGARTAELTYFSLATITTTGYGDLAPVHPFARSLANLEAVFGLLFPATVLARLISMHLAHERYDAFAPGAEGAGEADAARRRRTEEASPARD